MESLETTAGRMKALADELCEQAKHAKVDSSQHDGVSPSPTEQKLLLMLEKNKHTMAQMTARIKELYAEVEGLAAQNEELTRSLEEAKGLNCTGDGAGGGGGTLADVVQRLKAERTHRLQAEEQYASIITQQEETTRRLEERLRQAYTVIEDYEEREARAGGSGPPPPSGVSPPSARYEAQEQQQPHVSRQQAREPSAVPPTLDPPLGLGHTSYAYAAAAGSSPAASSAAASRAPSLPGYAAAAPPSSAGSPDKTFNYNNCVPPAVQTMREQQQPRQHYHQQQPQQQYQQQEQQQRQHPSQPQHQRQHQHQQQHQQQQQQQPRYHPSSPHASAGYHHPVRPAAQAQPQPHLQPPQSLPASSRSPSSAVAASSSNGLSRSVTPSGHYDVVTSFLEDMRQALDSMNEEEAERAADIQLSQAVSHAKGLTPRGPPTAEAIARSVRKTGM